MAGYPGLNVVLPGRLGQLELDQVSVEHWGTFTLVVFIMSIDSNVCAINYRIETRLWDIDICEAHFAKIPLATAGHVHDADAVRVLQKLLVEGDPKGAKHRAALRHWRNLLMIRSVKIIPLRK